MVPAQLGFMLRDVCRSHFDLEVSDEREGHHLSGNSLGLCPVHFSFFWFVPVMAALKSALCCQFRVCVV